MTRLVALCYLLFLLLPAVVRSAPPEDEIQWLPGLKSPPSFKQYSGYLKASDTKRLHYWLVESTQSPKRDPLAVWLNGGPGCSSLLGLLTENGPFRVQDDGRTLADNPYSWNTVANVLYIESPAGVGFSYSTDLNYTTSDDLTAMENYAAMTDFFTKFPEYQANDLYITGESYGGIYVPMLSNLLLGDNRFNLKGFAVGNGVSNDEYLGDSLMYFAYYHGLIDTLEWRTMLQECCSGEDHHCRFVNAARSSPVCRDLVAKVNDIVQGGSFDVYNLYAPCAGGVGGVGGPLDTHHTLLFRPFNFLRRNKTAGTAWRPQPVGDERCQNDTAITTYTNLPEVRKALHIPTQVQKWLNCVDYGEGWYTQIYNDTAPFYHRLLNAGIPGVVYNGDVDMACNFLGDEWFVDSLHRPLKEGRKMWFYYDEQGFKQVAGIVKTFDLITYATVRGSGHMVPTDRPQAALVMFSNLVQNKPF